MSEMVLISVINLLSLFSDEEDYCIVHVAMHPDIFKEIGGNKAEQDAIIQIVMLFLEDSKQVKLSRAYTIETLKFKGDITHIREDFGLASDPMSDLSKLKDFAPVADIVTRDESVTDEFKGLIIDGKKKSPEHLGTTDNSNCKALIEEVYSTPKYSLDESDSSQIKVYIYLDTISSMFECFLDVTASHLLLKASDYKLELELSSIVIPDRTTAKFSKSKHLLTVTLVKDSSTT